VTAQFEVALEECTGLDDPRWRAAEMIADAWQPALAHSYEMGRQDGYAAGYAEAERDMAARWHSMWTKTRKVLRRPTFAELQRRRGEAA
jgi:hypothetical protein